jgi:hypothetical protein
VGQDQAGVHEVGGRARQRLGGHVAEEEAGAWHGGASDGQELVRGVHSDQVGRGAHVGDQLGAEAGTTAEIEGHPGPDGGVVGEEPARYRLVGAGYQLEPLDGERIRPVRVAGHHLDLAGHGTR